MMGILDSLGCRCALHGNRLEIDTSKMNGWRIEQNAMGKMRSSIMLLGALLGRFCEAGVYSPGGCMIGKRPIDWHLRALRALGAEIQEPEPDGFLHAQTTGLRLPLWQRWGGRFCGDVRGNRRLDSCAIS